MEYFKEISRINFWNFEKNINFNLKERKIQLNFEKILIFIIYKLDEYLYYKII
jgi:hypothetical protein